MNSEEIDRFVLSDPSIPSISQHGKADVGHSNEKQDLVIRENNWYMETRVTVTLAVANDIRRSDILELFYCVSRSQLFYRMATSHILFERPPWNYSIL